MRQADLNSSRVFFIATGASWAIVEVVSTLIFQNLDIVTIITAASLAILLPTWLIHPRSVKAIPNGPHRIGIGIGVWIIITGMFLVANVKYEDTNLLNLETEAETQLQLAQSLATLTQIMLTEPRIPEGIPSVESPKVELQTRLIPGNSGGEASIAVKNIGQVPLIMEGNWTIVDSSKAISIGGIPVSIRWKGSTARQRILMPGLVSHMDIVASGIPRGWRLPRIGVYGNYYCLNFLTADAAFQQGYVSLFCQNDWRPFAGLSQDDWAELEIRLSARPLTQMTQTLLINKTYRVSIADNPFNLTFQEIYDTPAIGPAR